MDEIGNEIVGLLNEMKGVEGSESPVTPIKNKVKSIDEEEK